MIEYKGYTGVFEFDPSIDAFHGRIVGLQDVVRKPAVQTGAVF